jgi:hypothetical protein
MPQVEEKRKDLKGTSPPEEVNQEIAAYKEWRPKMRVPGDHPYRRRI